MDPPVLNYLGLFLVPLGLVSTLQPSCSHMGTQCSPQRSHCSRRITVPVQSFSNLQIRGEAAAVWDGGRGGCQVSVPEGSPTVPRYRGDEHDAMAMSPVPTIPQGSSLLLRPMMSLRPTSTMRVIVF